MDQPPLQPAAAPAPVAPATGRAFFWVSLAIGAALLAFAALVLFTRWSGRDATNDAYVSGHVHVVAPRVAGTVTAVLVDDNQHVDAGEVIARLDEKDFEVRRQLAVAQIAQADAQRLASRAQVRQARAGIDVAQAALKRAELEYARNSDLIGQSPRGISRQEFDASLATRDAARGTLVASEAQLVAAQAAERAAAALGDTGRANLHDADLALSYVEIRAPVSGRVGRKSVETGARVNVGQSLLAIVSEDVWVVANFREVQLARVNPGTTIRLTIDAIPGRSFDGVVESLSPATGSQFSLLPPDNATGNFTKVVQRVPVKILFRKDQIDDVRDRLVPGLSVIAEVVSAARRPSNAGP